MHADLLKFFKRQTVVSVCLMDTQGLPSCFSCFYAFDEKHFILYFKTSRSTMHGSLMAQDVKVAGTIQQDKLKLLAIQGVQYTGTLVSPAQVKTDVYYLKFPFAYAIPGEVWGIHLGDVKFTNNKAGIGKKILWSRKAVGSECSFPV